MKLKQTWLKRIFEENKLSTTLLEWELYLDNSFLSRLEFTKKSFNEIVPSFFY